MIDNVTAAVSGCVPLSVSAPVAPCDIDQWVWWWNSLAIAPHLCVDWTADVDLLASD